MKPKADSWKGLIKSITSSKTDREKKLNAQITNYRNLRGDSIIDTEDI